MQDRLQRETDDKKNELESYIYAMRSKLSDTLAAYIPEAAKDALVSRLTDLEVRTFGSRMAVYISALHAMSV